MPTTYDSLGITTINRTEEQLFAGQFPRHQQPIVVASGEGVLTKGTVLGKITASGKFAAYDNAASDGSQTAVGVLGCDVDASSGDVSAFMWTTGEFNEAKLIGLDTAGRADLEAINLYPVKLYT